MYGYSSSGNSYRIVITANTPPTPSPTPSITQTPAPSVNALGRIALNMSIGGSLPALGYHYYQFTHTTPGRAIAITGAAVLGNPSLALSLTPPVGSWFNATVLATGNGGNAVIVAPGDSTYPSLGAQLYIRVRDG